MRHTVIDLARAERRNSTGCAGENYGAFTSAVVMWRKGALRPLLTCSARIIAQMKLWLFIYAPSAPLVRTHFSDTACPSCLRPSHRVLSPDRRCLSISLCLFSSFEIIPASLYAIKSLEMRFTVAARRRCLSCSRLCLVSSRESLRQLVCFVRVIWCAM